MVHQFRYYLLPLIMLASAIILGSALIAQYVFDMKPCELCIYQRIPYVSVLLFGGIALAIGEWNKRAVGYLLSVIFFISSTLALYHAGVEYKWWHGVTACAGYHPLPESLAELKLNLSKVIPIACDEISWTLLGVSITVYNGIASIVLSLLCVYGTQNIPSGSRCAEMIKN
ncbi:uncharacterized protein METZ01_LOCUS406521 [marine metagenome]|uniref:Disulfide bond formation protein B n=1 Tax=marine metagenome TaxID=408172 RepID=A0A382W4G3_9ZZZZ